LANSAELDHRSVEAAWYFLGVRDTRFKMVSARRMLYVAVHYRRIVQVLPR
jgi:hypothetical protein